MKSTQQDWETLAVALEKTVITACRQFEALSEGQQTFRPGPDAWSVREILGHLIDSASNNHQRFVRLQITDPLDFPDYGPDNHKWIQVQHYQEKPLAELLELLRCFNMHLAHIIRNADTACIDHLWRLNEHRTISLGDMMADYVVHMKAHFRQIEENLKACPISSGSSENV